MSNAKVDKLQYYEVIQLFDDNKVEAFTLNLSSGQLKYRLVDDKVEDVDKNGNENYPHNYTVPNVTIFYEDIHEQIREYNIANPKTPIKADYNAGRSNSWIVSLLPQVLLIGVLLVVTVIMFRKMNQSIGNDMNKTMTFGKARVKQAKDEKRKNTFADVAGADEEKEELAEIVEFLREPLKFNDLGAKIPRGILLVGPPGTGKTLLARAVAGEADVPFFSISGSDFVEMYVGVGASRVRDLFAQAKKNSPSIIFIDEIDAVGRHRGAGMGGGHDEREQTLNQLLVEMDGFGVNEGVIIIAATNRPDILDPALLRPGRFDRQITVGRPDVKGREEILKVHAKNKPLAPDVDLRLIANSTAGFTGADLENLLNESALLAARRGKKAITKEEIEEATIKVIVGTEKKSHKITPKEKKLVSYHEAGHALSTYYLESQDPVHQISIIPRGMAGGYTMSIPTEDKNYISRKDILDDLVVLLGGRVAEALVLGDISSGASNDIERATDLVRNMVTRYGMSDKLGPINFGSSNHEVFLGKDYSQTRNYSENVAALIDSEMELIIRDAYDRTEKILSEHMDKLHIIAEVLMVKEKIDGKDFEALMNGSVTKDEFLGITEENAEEAETFEDGAENE
ncbi:MAG: ATP-dependent zinc metalloprotease FtsH [Ruminococcaceae bacterium]|nr:ATP-dependent zinc metalloprotease FtsH [Oscillospiraceae bacterium]